MFGERSSRTRISLKSQPMYIYALIDARDDTVRAKLVLLKKCTSGYIDI